ncbi:hypothetical protein [Actinotalea sp. K2]|nr:hypothetical protein [Actinotalea sp. K2]
MEDGRGLLTQGAVTDRRLRHAAVPIGVRRLVQPTGEGRTDGA